MELTGTAYHPDFGGDVHYAAVPLSSDPDKQVAETINLMRANVRADSYSEPVLRAAQQMDTGAGDPLSDAFYWTAGRVRFQQDEQTAAPLRRLFDDDVVEVLIRPRDLANMARPVEDCDGFAQMLPALLRSRGIPCSFVTIAADAREPNRYSHVYAACYPNGRRVALDASHGPYPGWEAPNMYGKKKEWPIDGPDWEGLAWVAAFAAALLLAGYLWGGL
jgi:transglutaminase-like putative cysteine protease